MQEYYTEDLSKFGYRERVILEAILEAWNTHGLPSDFFDNQVRPAFNMNSGNVFLVNSEYQVCMLCDGTPDTLEVWHTLPYSGEEGFIFDLQDLDQDSMHPDDIEYLSQFEPLEA